MSQWHLKDFPHLTPSSGFLTSTLTSPASAPALHSQRCKAQAANLGSLIQSSDPRNSSFQVGTAQGQLKKVCWSGPSDLHPALGSSPCQPLGGPAASTTHWPGLLPLNDSSGSQTPQILLSSALHLQSCSTGSTCFLSLSPSAPPQVLGQRKGLSKTAMMGVEVSAPGSCFRNHHFPTFYLWYQCPKGAHSLSLRKDFSRPGPDTWCVLKGIEQGYELLRQTKGLSSFPQPAAPKRLITGPH